MGRVEVDFGDAVAVMIDGFVPPYEYFKELDWPALRKTREGGFIEYYYTKFYPHLRARPDDPDRSAIYMFTSLVNACRHDFCPYGIAEPPPYSSHSALCSYTYYTSGRNPRSLETQVRLRDPLSSDVVPRLQPEFRRDEKAGRTRYIQNVIWYPTGFRDIHCQFADECADRWIAQAGLEEKAPGLYADYTTFSEAWRDYLACRFT